MKFSYNWLQNHFEEKLPEANVLAEKIGLHSFELEGVDEIENNGKKDWLIEWDILPNRSSDCLCYMGMVKEIETIFETKANIFITKNLMKEGYSKKIKTSDFLSLEVEDKNLVKRATKRIAVNVKVGESPQWLKDSLKSMGQKSINNVVDITNYVMWTTGQPVHAFDYDKLVGEENFKKIKIGFAKKGEKITDLTGTEHEMDENILVISDGEKSLDIAGIKGGNNSGVDESTTRLMLSAVNFEFENIRNTSKKLKLQTDASKRFENDVPVRKVILAMNQMSYLLKELAGAEISEEILDTNENYMDNREIKCSVSKINSLLGTKLSKEEMAKILDRLYMKKEILEDEFIISVQEDRLDLNIWQDIAEEVGRVYGYENIDEKFPNEGFQLPTENKIKKSMNEISDYLVDCGFFEVCNRTLVEDGKIDLKNSLNANATVLRENLLNGINKKIEKNFSYTDEPKFFEIGKVFAGTENKKKDRVVDEYFSFAGVIGKKKIKEKNKEVFFYRTKGYLEKIFEKISVKNIVWKNFDKNNFVAEIFCEGESIGKIGINNWEINLEKLINNSKEEIFYKKVSKYPKIERDVAFFTPMDYFFEDAEKIIKNSLPEEATDLELFDIYKDEENNKKSFAFKIIFQSDEKTLDDEFVNNEMEKIYEILKENNFEVR